MLPEQSNISLEHNAGENRSEDWLRISEKYFHSIEDMTRKACVSLENNMDAGTI